jgi:hypothetical protein
VPDLKEAVEWALLGFVTTGFLLMVLAFGLLFRRAWQSGERRAAVRKVLFVQPCKNEDWPNGSREADLIALGAFFGVLSFCIFAAMAFL